MTKFAPIPYDTLAKLKAGEHSAFLDIYESYHRGLYTFIHSYLHDGRLAEDVVHDVFMKLWEVKSRIDPERSLVSYLYRIARNAIYKALKKRVAIQSLDNMLSQGAELEFQAVSSEEIYQEREYEKLFEDAVNALPPQRQRVFKLCRQQGKTYKEVACQLRISTYTVKEHMSLAMKSIQDHMDKNAGLTLSRMAILFTLSMLAG